MRWHGNDVARCLLDDGPLTCGRADPWVFPMAP